MTAQFCSIGWGGRREVNAGVGGNLPTPKTSRVSSMQWRFSEYWLSKSERRKLEKIRGKSWPLTTFPVLTSNTHSLILIPACPGHFYHHQPPEVLLEKYLI